MYSLGKMKTSNLLNKQKRMKKLGNDQYFVLLSSVVSGADEAKAAAVGRRAEV